MITLSNNNYLLPSIVTFNENPYHGEKWESESLP